MRTHRLYPLMAILAIFALVFSITACGDDDDSSSGSSDTTEQTSGDDSGGDTSGDDSGGDTSADVDSAIQRCKDKAADLGGVAATALQGACTSVGAAAIQAANAGGEQASQALITAADSCDTTLASIPDATAKDALQELCDAIRAAGEG